MNEVFRHRSMITYTVLVEMLNMLNPVQLMVKLLVSKIGRRHLSWVHSKIAMTLQPIGYTEV